MSGEIMAAQPPDREKLVDLVTRITVEVLKELESRKDNITFDASGPVSMVGPCNADPNDCQECGYCTAKKPDTVDQFIEAGVSRISSRLHTPAVAKSLAGYIDHTLLKPEASQEELKKLCDEAKTYCFKSVCVNPNNVAYCARELRGSGVGVTAVIGFPLGATTTRVKAFETDEAIRNGATEIDMVINISLLKNKDYCQVLDDIHQVVRAAQGKLVKVILETGVLNTVEKTIGCALAKAAGASYVKTSTGFGKGGATIEDIKLMRDIVGPELGVKASGGIRDKETAEKMIEAGATRLGASASVAIVGGQAISGGGY